jgi:membrane-bound lytic murein transglycosylase D
VPDTARRYGLVVSERRDDRIDLLKSTRAAARYLRDLYHQFGNWRLALAAYNAGEGALQQAVRRGGSFNLQLLSDRKLIPTETRSYVFRRCLPRSTCWTSKELPGSTGKWLILP